MKTLSSREIMGELRVFGVSKKKDLFLYLILYKSYYSLNYPKRFRQTNGLKRFVDKYIRRFDRLNISCSYNSDA